MSTFKTDLFDLCEAVAADFPGWSFVSRAFKNKSFKHTDLIVYPGFGIEHGSTALQPSINVNNKRSMALYKAIMGYEQSTSVVNFQAISHELSYMPEHLRLTSWIVQDKDAFMAIAKTTKVVEERTIDIKDARPVLVAMMRDGISFIERHYDLSSEEAFLKHLPPRYATRHVNLPYDQMERQKGIMMCIVRVLLGDFDFVEQYRNDSFETIFPKRTAELDKLIAALPGLKRRYIESGSVI